jgi:hypothetical protein
MWKVLTRLTCASDFFLIKTTNQTKNQPLAFIKRKHYYLQPLNQKLSESANLGWPKKQIFIFHLFLFKIDEQSKNETEKHAHNTCFHTT